MDTMLTDVLLANMYWERSNTPDMADRGVLVRRDIPAWIEQRRAELAAALGGPTTDLGVEGRDGTGLKSRIPWVRVHSLSRSPSATTGWYVVYLFSADGSSVYLSLNQGTTIWSGADFKPRPAEELRSRGVWARNALASADSVFDDLLPTIDLGAEGGDLARAYELGNVVALRYAVDAVPRAQQITADLLRLVALLAVVERAYGAAGFVPGDLPPELFNVVVAAELAAGVPGGRARGGQGFGLTKEQQTAVEMHAVHLAREWLKASDYELKYVGDKKTWDIEAEKDGQTFYVEVKGTTSPGASVILTGPQVREYSERHPATMLIVVRNIALDRQASPPAADGGQLEVVAPWNINPDNLEAISYRYSTGL